MQSVRSNSSHELPIVSMVLLAFLGLACQACGGPQRTGSEVGDVVEPAKMFADPSLLAAARAIESGDLSKLDALLRNGTSVNGRGNDGATLLMFAVGTRKKDAVRELLKFGADPNQMADTGLSPVMLAAGSDEPDLLPILLHGGANPNLRNDQGEPVTFTAAHLKRWRNLDMLLDQGADINATDGAGDTLLISLAFSDHYEPIVKLLQRGADFRKTGEGGWTLANSIQKSRLRPDSSDGQWLQKAKTFLVDHGITFPVPPPKPQH